MTGTHFPEVEFLEDNVVRFSSGTELSNVHLAEDCLGDVCPIHKPTDHYLRGEILDFNGKHMVRIVDGDVFIDPDDYLFRRYGTAILWNAAQCALCKDVIESRNRHDFVTCECGEISVDGGTDYLRRGARDLRNVIDLSVVFNAETGQVDLNENVSNA